MSLFFTQPQINRVSLHLKATLDEECKFRWSELLLKTDNPFVIDSVPAFDSQPVNAQEILATPSWFREKMHFNWGLDRELDGAIEEYVINNAKQCYEFYHELFELAEAIDAELQKTKPDYEWIILKARQIQTKSTTVPSILSGDPIKLQVGWWIGDNLVLDLLKGIIGAIHAPLMALAGVLCIVPYCMSSSKYCGSPEFFLDTAIYFCESLRKITFSVLFPLNLLYSKHNTGSFNSVTKGGVERSVESIISLAQEAIKNNNKIIPVNETTGISWTT